MCAVDCEGQFVAGNVRERTLKDIWNIELRTAGELHRNHRFSELPQVCRSCLDWDVKRALAWFPDDSSRKDYESYGSSGRTLHERQVWDYGNLADDRAAA